MGDRYSSRYSRPRSPVMSNPGRISLPNVGYGGGGYNLGGDYGESSYPSRDVISQPRSSGDRLIPTTTTKYRVIPSGIDPPRSSNTRGASRSRSATIDSSGRPMVISPVPRLGPVIHHPRVARPASPLSNPYRASDETAYLVPATSHHHQSRGHHRNGYSIDNGSEYRAKNRDWDRPRISSGRESAAYLGSRSRTSHSGGLVTASDDYLDTGYSYTNPREVVKYELDHTLPRHSRHRRDSSETRSRPASIASAADLGAKSFDARERGPPPATRGRDKLPPITRSTFDVALRPRTEMAYESDSRSRKARPVSMYQERDVQRSQRDATYDSRDTDARERPSREKTHHQSRHDEDDRSRNSEKHGYGDKRDHHKSRDTLTATLVAAAGALGLGAVNNSKDNDREERDEPPRRLRDDSDEDRRRRRKVEDIEPLPVDSGSRNPREKPRAREGGRDSPQYERDGEYKRDLKDRHSASSQSPPREKRSSPPLSNDSRTRHETITVIDHPKEKKSKNRSRSNSGSNHSSELSSSDKDRSSRREKERNRIEPATPTTPSAFNPKDTMDLRALKAMLNRQEEPKEVKRQVASSAAVVPLVSSRDRDYDSRDDDRGRRNLIDESQPPRELREPHNQIRVVSPPRETQVTKAEDKPVKGILRAPRDKFPEDPTHIREGVAPLKDAKKDGVPPDARWTKISRSMVNPAALEAGKERFEEQDDHVIVLRVLSKEEIQAYATITESIRAAREEEEKDRQRRHRRERHERHKRERADHHRSSRRRREEDSESDTTEEDDRENDHVRSIEAPDAPRPRRIAFDDQTLMSGGLGDLKENPNEKGTFTGYVRNPPPPDSKNR